MTIRRSTSSLSCFIALWKNSGRFSPKNTMSGFIIARGISGGHLGHRGTTCNVWCHISIAEICDCVVKMFCHKWRHQISHLVEYIFRDDFTVNFVFAHETRGRGKGSCQRKSERMWGKKREKALLKGRAREHIDLGTGYTTWRWIERLFHYLTVRPDVWNLPWHWMILWTPAACSRVSMFCV